MSSPRSILTSILLLWLLLSLARLTFDLIGKLWIVTIFDLLQIVCCITGLFGSLQKRRCLLYALLISNIFSISQNALIFLWYIGIFGEITRPVLSAGLPYSFSFFLRFTPTCQSHFDLKRTIWVQHTCLIPFYSIEASQAILHILLAIVTSALTIFTLLEKRKPKSHVSSNNPINHYAQINPPKNVGSIGESPSVNGSTSAYNSTYDELRSHQSSKIEERSSSKRNNKKIARAMPAPDVSACSPTKSSEDESIEDVYTKPIKKRSSSLGSNQQESFSLPLPSQPTCSNMTNLVSFDPKSTTILRIRQHLEEDRETPDRLYEQLRSTTTSTSPPPSTIPLSSYKSRNASQDSVPSIFAPMLNSPSSSSSSNSSTSGGTVIQKSGNNMKKNLVSPGIRLSDQLGNSTNTNYKSAFRVQTNVENHRIIGHYHAPNEIPLSSDPSECASDNYPVLTSGGLLV